MRAPRVAHLVIALDHGGLERCVLLWTDARNGRRPESTSVLCLDRTGPLAGRLPAGTVHDLATDRPRFPWDRQAVKRLRHALQAQAVDIVHSHNTAARFYAALAVRGSRVKHLYTDHGTNPHLRDWRDRLRLRFMDAHTHTRVAVSEPAARALAGARHAATGAVSVIPNGIAPAAIGDRRLREQLALPAEACLIGCVGRLAPEKGVDRLLRAFVTLPTHCHLAIIGDGPAHDALDAQVGELPATVADRIHFSGAVDEARVLMPAFDLFVLPSRGEGLPLALLEAMAEGVPVAATRVGQCPAVLEDGGLGLLLPDDESGWPALLTAEVAAIGSGQRESTRVAAQRRVAETYSLDRTLDAYEARYQTLVGTP